MGQAMQQQYEQAQDKQGNKLAQSKGRGNRKWSRWRKGCVIEVPSLARSTSPFGEGVEAQCSPRSQLGPPYSPHALTDARCRDSTNGALKAHTKPLQSRMGLLHNKPETPTNTTKLHHNGMWLRGVLKLSRTPSPKSKKIQYNMDGEQCFLWMEV